MNTIVPKLKTLQNASQNATERIAIERLCVEANSVFAAEAEIFAQRHGLPAAGQESQKGRTAPIRFRQDTSLSEEGYRLEANEHGVTVWAHCGKGAIAAGATLSQWLWQAHSLPCVRVEDAPSYPWRGFMLDVSRHFFPLSYVKELIEQLSLYKFNRLHLHLTDDQGWRVEIPSHPKLTQIGSRRFASADALYAGKGNEIGYFSQDDIAQIVCHAAKYHIEIVPEIDVPGHTLAAVTAYPEFTCFPEELAHLPISQTWGIYKEILCLGKPETWDFVYKILDEICAVFPSRYLHLGGDEVPRDHWERCPRCRDFCRQHKLASGDELQNLFTQKTRDYLIAKGKTPLYWDEVAESGLSRDTVVCHWRSKYSERQRVEQEENTEDWDTIAAGDGAKVISCPTKGAYFDYAHNSDPHERGALAVCSVYDTYHFATLKDKRPDLAAYSLGVQGNLWTERVLYAKDCEYLIYPRLLAMAEQGWGRNTEDWDWFQSVWPQQKSVLKALNVRNYYRGAWR